MMKRVMLGLLLYPLVSWADVLAPAKLSEKELWSHVRLTTQESYELGKVALEKLSWGPVKSLTKRLVRADRYLDRRMTSLALDLAGVAQPHKMSTPLIQRLYRIEKLEGEDFLVDYLNMQMDLHRTNVRLLEELQSRTTERRATDFISKALDLERDHLHRIEKLLAPYVPDVPAES